MNITDSTPKAQKYDTALFWAVCLLLFFLQYFFGLQHFYFDAERYWESGRELKVDGVFDLGNHVTPRGILFPLFNYGLIEVLGYLNWHEITVYKGLNTVFCTWGFWYVLPAVLFKITGQTLGSLQKLALVCISNVFWFRYFSCPLSDFLCFFLLLWAFLLLWSERPLLIHIIVVGVVCGFIFNTRPIYVLLLAVYPLFYLIVSAGKWHTKLIHILLMLVMAVLVNIPQYRVNQKVWNSNTIFQPTDKYYDGKSLYLIQLKWGLYVQKYETYVGDRTCYPEVAAFYFHDKSISKAEQNTIHRIETYEQYITYLIAHPGCVLWFAKNAFNGLDIQYNSVYVFDMKPRVWFQVLNYLVWFTGMVLIVLCRKNWARSKPFLIVLGYLLFTALLSIPTAIEVRFLLALYCFIYLLVVSQFYLLVQFWRESSFLMRIILLGSAILCVTGCLYLSQTTYQQLQFDVNC
jgi:hypothetical protein